MRNLFPMEIHRLEMKKVQEPGLKKMQRPEAVVVRGTVTEKIQRSEAEEV